MAVEEDLELELAEAEKALSLLRGEMDTALADQGGIPREQAEMFARRMESLRDRITLLKKAIAAREGHT